MIYSNTTFTTNLDAAYYEKQWHLFYTLYQSRTNLEGIKEEREVTFSRESGKKYEDIEKEIIQESFEALAEYNFDLFKIPDSKFISLKERLEDGKIKNNQITKD